VLAKKPLQKLQGNKPLKMPNAPAKKPRPLRKPPQIKPLPTPHITKPSTRFCLR